ncbi:hypothetical protein B0H13DRAFT_1888897 [Mycena leptocephala]|nr:hypothetical protein B0H13DRAFT_1888897 [Mycena leptocephala]
MMSGGHQGVNGKLTPISYELKQEGGRESGDENCRPSFMLLTRAGKMNEQICRSRLCSINTEKLQMWPDFTWMGIQRARLVEFQATSGSARDVVCSNMEKNYPKSRVEDGDCGDDIGKVLKYSVAARLRRHYNLYPRVVDRGSAGFMDLGRRTHGIGWLGDAGVQLASVINLDGRQGRYLNSSRSAIVHHIVFLFAVSPKTAPHRTYAAPPTRGRASALHSALPHSGEQHVPAAYIFLSSLSDY